MTKDELSAFWGRFLLGASLFVVPVVGYSVYFMYTLL